MPIAKINYLFIIQNKINMYVFSKRKNSDRFVTCIRAAQYIWFQRRYRNVIIHTSHIAGYEMLSLHYNLSF